MVLAGCVEEGEEYAGVARTVRDLAAGDLLGVPTVNGDRVEFDPSPASL